MRRLELSLLALMFACVALSPVLAGQDSGRELLQKMQRALGGADKIAAIRDLDWAANADTFDHAGNRIGQVTKRTRWIRPNYLRLDQVGPGDTYVLYFDGTAGWEILPGTTTPIELAGSELEFARGYLSGFMLNLWVADRSASTAISSPAPHVVRISSNTNTSDITLNPETWRPVQIAEWMEVDGVQFPRREINVHKGDGSAYIQTQAVLFNGGLKPVQLAAKPSDGKPVLTDQ
jgi:hypothetical protein